MFRSIASVKQLAKPALFDPAGGRLSAACCRYSTINVMGVWYDAVRE